jgi:hypothetical protein
MSKKWVTFLLVVFVLMFALSACGSLKDVSKLGDKFMSALKTQDNETSYAMLSPDIQYEVGYEAGWAEWTSIRAFNDWKFTSKSVENNLATLEGTAHLDGEEYLVTLAFTRNGDAWEITTIIFELP